MKITVITLFPEMFVGPFDHSILKRAAMKNLLEITFVNIRQFATDPYGSVDDKPYGGGHGMILRVDIVDKAIDHAKSLYNNVKPHVVLIDAQGAPYTQKKASSLALIEHLILVCGHYEGFDERIRNLVDEEISIGDYILTGGEIPAMVLVDSIARLLPGALTKEISSTDESFTASPTMLEHPQYTRPELYKNMLVPSILLSGNHKNIQEWRVASAVEKTIKRRPDLANRKLKD